MVDKEELARLAVKMKDAEIARYFGVSRQRIHQIRTGYKSPSSKRVILVSELKILTKRKREWLGMSDEDYYKL